MLADAIIQGVETLLRHL